MSSRGSYEYPPSVPRHQTQRGESITKVTGPGVSLETERGSFSVGCSNLEKWVLMALHESYH